MLNSYGGTFAGLRAAKGGNGKHDKESQVLIIKLGTLKNLALPKLEKPCKREFFVTAVFDTDNLEDVMEHQRNRSVTRLGEFENGYYTCSFHDHAITLPCKDRSFVRLYLSCITTIEEEEERKIVLNGLSYSDAYKISKLENYREEKTLTLVSDASIATLSSNNKTTMVKQGISGGILSFKIETKSSLGIYIPKDVTNNVLEAYKNEGKVFSNNSNKFDSNRFNSLQSTKSVGKPAGPPNSARSSSSKSSDKSISVAEAIKAFEKLGSKDARPVAKSNSSGGAEFHNPVVLPKSFSPVDSPKSVGSPDRNVSGVSHEESSVDGKEVDAPVVEAAVEEPESDNNVDNAFVGLDENNLSGEAAEPENEKGDKEVDQSPCEE